MRAHQPIRRDDDPLLRRAHRVLADVARLVGPVPESSSPNPSVPLSGEARRRLLAAAADLELLLRVLTKSQDALGIEMQTRLRHLAAVSAYDQCRTAGRRYARRSRRGTPTE
jgi:hypothetical protein